MSDNTNSSEISFPVFEHIERANRYKSALKELLDKHQNNGKIYEIEIADTQDAIEEFRRSSNDPDLDAFHNEMGLNSNFLKRTSGENADDLEKQSSFSVFFNFGCGSKETADLVLSEISTLQNRSDIDSIDFTNRDRNLHDRSKLYITSGATFYLNHVKG